MKAGHALALVAAASLGLGACASPPTAVREYILHPVAAEGSPSSSVATPDVAAPPPAHESGPIVAVGPIVIPAYLRRSTIVTREAEQRVETSERHQWAEALDAGFARVLAENLAVQIPTNRVAALPWPVRTPPEYEVSVSVQRFEHDAEGVSLEARWVLSSTASETPSHGPIATRSARIRETVPDDGYPAIVDAMSRSIRVLGNDIAAEIRAHRVATAPETP
ncbi:MAG: PqiC family protein [Proteobacteria bacterium]|nr:PqiC family protein [Pseudomonadota bacterium]